MKQCFVCQQTLPLVDFYTHPRMADGHLNKCKSCTKQDAKKRRDENLFVMRAYDRGRGNRQEPEYLKIRRKAYPNQTKAQALISRLVAKGDLVKQPCEECGSQINVHAHHDDYLKPNEIRWLCTAHHRQWHVVHGPGLNRNNNFDPI